MCGLVVLVVLAPEVLVAVEAGVLGVCAAANLPGPFADPSLRPDATNNAPTVAPASTATTPATIAIRRARPRRSAQRCARDGGSDARLSGATVGAVESSGAGFSGATGGSDTTPNAT